MLTENEWNTINNMLLELYTIDELDVFTSKILKMIRMLIPYTKGWFIILDDDRKIRKEQSYFIGFDTDVKDKYTDVFYNEDYIQYLYDFVSETSVYKDTSIDKHGNFHSRCKTKLTDDTIQILAIHTIELHVSFF